MSTDPTEGAPVVPGGAEATKAERSDTPLTEAEATQKGIKNFSLERFPITPAAHDFLKQNGMAPYQPFWQRFWDGLRRRAAEASKQLTRAEVETLLKEYSDIVSEERAEHGALYQAETDKMAPEAEFTCQFPGGCTDKVTSTTWNYVVRGIVWVHGAGPKQGQPIRRGVFMINVNPKDGGTQIVGLCRAHLRQCVRDRQAAGMDSRSFPYEDAYRIVATIDGRREGRQEMLRGAVPPRHLRRASDEAAARMLGISTGQVLSEGATPPGTPVGNVRLEKDGPPADRSGKRRSQR